MATEEGFWKLIIFFKIKFVIIDQLQTKINSTKATALYGNSLLALNFYFEKKKCFKCQVVEVCRIW